MIQSHRFRGGFLVTALGLCFGTTVMLADPPEATAPNAAPQAATPQGERSEPLIPLDKLLDLVKVRRDIVYARVTDKDGQPIDLKLDAVSPREAPAKPMPAVVYIHGGGWSMGNKQMGLRPSVGLALGGYFAVTIQYRLSGQAIYPAAVHDCKAAIRFLRAHAEKYGIDPQRIGVWGHSAGGHLAALLGTSGNSDVLNGDVGAPGIDPALSSAVQCVVDISGPTDLSVDAPRGMISQWLGGPVRDKQDLAKQASPLTYIDAKDPPVLIIHGSIDRLVNIDRQARPFEKTLKESGVAVEFLEVKEQGHIITDRAAYRRAAEFFDQHLGGKAAETIENLFGKRESDEPADAEGQ